MEAKEFGTLRSTYQMACFFLCVSMMYPHPQTNTRRIVGTLIMNVIMVPLVTIVLIDCYYSLLRQDLLNLIYHSTVIGPYLGGLTKVIASLYKSQVGHELLCEMEKDYEIYNTLPERYRIVVRKAIKDSIKYCQNYWSLIVMVSVLCYPLVSSILNIGSQLFAENPRKYMVHDVILPMMEPEDRFDSPIFEIVYVLMVYASVLIMIYFLGYDSLFGILVNHACLKINIYCMKFEDALKCRSKRQRRRMLASVIQEQLGVFEFVEKTEDYFSVYLTIMLFATLIQIGTCLYHINESEEMELQYMMIGFGSICCIFFPCAYATNLKFVAEESATKFYCAGWESVHCISTRRTIIFMIARAQIPLLIRAFSWIVFDMDLFISIIKSAYSIYTLLCS